MYWEIDVQLYNIASTGLPIVVADILDKDLPAPFSIEYPDLYVATQIDISSICTPSFAESLLLSRFIGYRCGNVLRIERIRQGSRQ